MMYKIGLVQAQATYDASVNLQTLLRFAKEAAEASCRVVCFPECYLTGYLPEEAEKLAIAAESPLLKQLSQAAETLCVDILAGFMEKEGDRFYITHGIFRKDGLCNYYRKTHLGQREKLFFSPGDDLTVFTLTDGLKIGLQLCVETHYPQITQTLALKGAEVIFAPHAVPRVSGDRQKIWGKYIPARSYDNRLYLACCNLLDPERYGGGCLVTDPRGEVTAACFADAPSLLTCQIDPELVASFRNPSQSRSRHFYPGSRRTELYL